MLLRIAAVIVLASLALPATVLAQDAPPASASPVAGVSASPAASGETYTIALGEQVSRSLVASGDGSSSTITYHTYVLQLNTSVNELVISVDGGDDDVDLVTQPSTPITRFAAASYQGLDAARQHRFSYLNPPAGEIYIDVVNKTAAPVSYTLTVTADLPVASESVTEAEPSAEPSEPPAETNPDPDIAAETTSEAASETVPEGEASTDTTTEDVASTDTSTDAPAEDTETADVSEADEVSDDLATDTAMNPTDTSTEIPEETPEETPDNAETTQTAVLPTDVLPTGTYGVIEVGERVTARIVSAAESNGLSYHTYILNVPENVSELTISVSGREGDDAGNIDLVTNTGDVVRRFSEADFNGVNPNTQERVAYVGAAGLDIYIDVVNRENTVLEYTLSVTPGAEARFVVRDGVLIEGTATAEPILDTAGVVIPSEPLPDGTYGVVPIGNTVTATISAAGSTGFTYNTYLVEVTEALDDLVLAVDVVDVDGMPAEATLDLVVQQGAIIEDYDTADYSSFATDDALFAVASPQVGTIYYLDVVNLSSTALPYRLSVGTSGPVVTPDRARDQEAASGVSVVAPSRRSSIVGALNIGEQAYGELQGKQELATFHTYVIDVPFGTEQLELVLQADQDLDMAVQAAPISDYTALGINLANSLRHNETVRIDDPNAGLWYVDVINGLGSGTSSYTLEVR